MHDPTRRPFLPVVWVLSSSIPLKCRREAVAGGWEWGREGE